MLRRTRLASSLGVLMAAALSLSCEGSGGTGQLVATPTSPAPSTLEIVAERTEYLVGMVDRLPQVIDRSSEYPTNTWPEWGSMNPDIVEILPNGRFLARGPGSVDLIATSPYPDQQARITLEVTSPYERTGEPRLTAVEILGPPVIHDRLGAFEDAVVAYGIRHDQTLREVAATLSSADPDILTVDNDGTIHVTGAGETTISASYEGHSMTTPIVVLTWEQFNEPFPRIYGERQDIACSPVLWTPNGSTPTLLLEGVTVPLLVFEVCPDGAMRRIHDARLVSSDPEIVEVGPGGLVTARRSGRAALRYEPPAASAPGGAAAITVLPAFNVTAETLGRRSYQDRPDDYEGPQIHLVYAVPEDVPDRGLDLSGEIEDSVAVVQHWIRQAIGYQLNLDTYGGRPDVSFVRLLTPLSGTQDSFADLLDGLDLALDLQQNKKYLVFTPGLNYAGRASRLVSAVFLDRYVGATWGDFVDHRLPRDLKFGVTSTEIVALHELFHTFGAAAECAPNFEAYHVNDTLDDVMTRGQQIDFGRDDYFGHGRADCTDTANSPYWRRVTSVATDAAATPRSERPDQTAPVTMEEQLRSLFVPDPTLRCGVPH